MSWLSGTLRGDPNVIAHHLSRHLRRALILPAGRLHWHAKWYSESCKVGDVTLAWSPRSGTNAPDEVLVEVPQRVLQDLGSDRALNLLVRLHGLGLRPTRIDVALNDPLRRATAHTVRSAFRRGDVKGHLRVDAFHEQGQRGRPHTATAILGSSHSRRRLRVYDGDAQHGHGGIRWELQSRDRDAVHLADALMTAPLATTVLAALTAFVDFRSRHGQAHAERAPRLRWWRSLIEHVDQVATLAPKARPVPLRVAGTFLSILRSNRPFEPRPVTRPQPIPELPSPPLTVLYQGAAP